MKILCVTHASRHFMEARASLNALGQRFAPGRLDALPPFASLPGVKKSVPYDGALTLWRLCEDDCCRPEFLARYDPGYKVQFADFAGDRLLVVGSDRLEVLDPDLKVVQTITDPWLAGCHTVHADDGGCAWVTSAPANAVLKIDIAAGRVIRRLPMPAQYGIGYALSESDDIKEHYPPTDLQPTHVNCAVPTAQGLLVTLWIPGAAGFLSEDGSYREVFSGFRGCHGARLDKDTGELYFADSAAGLLWFLDPARGSVQGRVRLATDWLHDCVQVSERLFAAALADDNAVQIIDRKTGEARHHIPCQEFGRSAMFVNAREVAPAWERLAGRRSPLATEASRPLPLPDPADEFFWLRTAYWQGLSHDTRAFAVPDGLRFENLLLSLPLELQPGTYSLQARIACSAGGVSCGISAVGLDDWLVQYHFDPAVSFRTAAFSLDRQTAVQVAVSARTPEGGAIRGRIEALELHALSPGADIAPGQVLAGKQEMERLRRELEERYEALVLRDREINRRDQEINRRDQEISRRDQEINRREELLRESNDRWLAEVERRDHMISELNDRLSDELRYRIKFWKRSGD